LENIGAIDACGFHPDENVFLPWLRNRTRANSQYFRRAGTGNIDGEHVLSVERNGSLKGNPIILAAQAIIAAPDAGKVLLWKP
jgi:hypothetical protein